RALLIPLPRYRFSSLFTLSATPPLHTLSLHDALPISDDVRLLARPRGARAPAVASSLEARPDSGLHRLGRLRARVPHASAGALVDRKSTRLNSSHQIISYAVFCLKKQQQSNYTILTI